MDRREMIKGLGIGTAAGAIGIFGGGNEAEARSYRNATNGLPPLKITNVKAIACAPHGIELIVVKVDTSEPGLYGLGCATFRQRVRPVISAINDYLHDFALGKDPSRIEDLWQTAWHGPGDVSPVGHAANLHIDYAIWNFGIQERHNFTPLLQEIFPGCPTLKKGYMYVNEAPGLGVDINEKLAAKYPIPDKQPNSWTQLRSRDGTAVRP